MNTENRTQIYENNLRTVEKLTNEAITARTLSRAFGDYAEIIDMLPTLGAVADSARSDIVEYAAQQSDHWMKIAADKENRAHQITVEMGS